MSLLKIFDLLLVTLALTSILLTLVSYVIFKTRQLPQMAVGKPEDILLEGSYFRRYLSPKALAKFKSPVVAPAPVAAPIWLRFLQPIYAPLVARFGSTGVFYATLTVAVFGSLLLQNYVTHPSGKRALAHEKVFGRKQLERQGLMKTYQFEPSASGKTSDTILDEVILPSQEARLASLIRDLASHRIALFQKAGSKAAPQAGWQAFLSKLDIPFDLIDDLRRIGKAELVIAPQPRTLSKVERGQVDQALSRGVGFLVTGALDVPDEEWGEKTFGVKWVQNKTPQSYFPTLFADGSRPGWDLPPGSLLSWFPFQNEYQAMPRAGFTAAREADYSGHPVDSGRVTRAQYHLPTLGGRAAWLALDPGKLTGFTVGEEFQIRNALVSSMAWAAQAPMGKVAAWKNGAQAAVLLSVDSEDQFENVDGFISIFKETSFPATFFLVSNLASQYSSMVDALTDRMELASHSENHDVFAGQDAQTQFDRIQTSRLEIEELGARKLLGFRPPFERYDSSTVLAALQNHLAYFAGDARFHRMAPAWVAGGKLLYFPRVALDDYAMSRRSGVPEHPDEVESLMIADFNLIYHFGGMYIFNSHTHIFGQPQYHLPMQRALQSIGNKPDLWKATFHEVSDWWRDREAIVVDVNRDPKAPDQWAVSLKNTSDRPIDGVVAELNVPSTGRLALTGATEEKLTQAESGELTITGIKLGPNQGKTLNLVLSR